MGDDRRYLDPPPSNLQSHSPPWWCEWTLVATQSPPRRDDHRRCPSSPLGRSMTPHHRSQTLGPVPVATSPFRIRTVAQVHDLHQRRANWGPLGNRWQTPSLSSRLLAHCDLQTSSRQKGSQSYLWRSWSSKTSSSRVRHGGHRLLLLSPQGSVAPPVASRVLAGHAHQARQLQFRAAYILIPRRNSKKRGSARKCPLKHCGLS